MDGLEAVEVRLSELDKDLRIESEFYKEEYRVSRALLEKRAYYLLADIVTEKITTGHTPSMKTRAFYDGDINFIKTDNLRCNNIQMEFTDKLTDLGNAELKRTQLRQGDIITTIIGATYSIIARTCMVTEEILPANINQNIALIRIDRQLVLPEVLNLYINSKYGTTYLHSKYSYSRIAQGG